MITKRRDSDATIYHDRESGHHTDAVPQVRRLRSCRLIDPSRETRHPRTVRVRADT